MMLGICGIAPNPSLKNRKSAQITVEEMTRASDCHFQRTSRFLTSQDEKTCLRAPTGKGKEADGIHLVYSGEIYNLLELERRWQVSSEHSAQHVADVLLAGFKKEGLDFVKALDGAFSIALYSKGARQVYLFRDPMGEKPLYYKMSEKGLVFSSCLEELGVVFPLEKISGDRFDRLQRATAYQGVYQIEPGTFLSYNTATCCPRLNRYWEMGEEENKEPPEDFEISERFEKALDLGIAMRTPLRPFALLWGGDVDSTILAFKMQPDAIMVCPVPGMESSTERAEDVARRIETSYVEIDFSRDSLPENIRTSMSPEYLAYHHAVRKNMRGVVSGVGADDLLLGRPRHEFFLSLERGSPLPPFFFGGKGSVEPCARYAGLIGNGVPSSALRECVNTMFQKGRDNGQAITLSDMAISLAGELAVSDKLAGQFGLDIRRPFLSPAFAKACLALPLHLKFNAETGQGKYALIRLAEIMGIPLNFVSDLQSEATLHTFRPRGKADMQMSIS